MKSLKISERMVIFFFLWLTTYSEWDVLKLFYLQKQLCPYCLVSVSLLRSNNGQKKKKINFCIRASDGKNEYQQRVSTVITKSWFSWSTERFYIIAWGTKLFSYGLQHRIVLSKNMTVISYQENTYYFYGLMVIFLIEESVCNAKDTK